MADHDNMTVEDGRNMREPVKRRDNLAMWDPAKCEISTSLSSNDLEDGGGGA